MLNVVCMYFASTIECNCGIQLYNLITEACTLPMAYGKRWLIWSDWINWFINKGSYAHSLMMGLY